MLALIHPVFVHFSAAFLVSGGIVEALGLLMRKERAQRFGATLVLAGTISLVPTVVTGFLAANSVVVPGGAEWLLSRHEKVGLSILALFLVTQLWKGWFGGRIPESQRWPYALVLLGGAALVGYGAFLGGEMVYAWGVGVGSAQSP